MRLSTVTWIRGTNLGERGVVLINRFTDAVYHLPKARKPFAMSNVNEADAFLQGRHALSKPVSLSRQPHIGPGKQDHEGSSQDCHSLPHFVSSFSRGGNLSTGRFPRQAPLRALAWLTTPNRGVLSE